MSSLRLTTALVCAVLLGDASAARAEPPSDYCRKVHARAAADASVLFAPSAVAQGLKFPRDGAIDTAATVGATTYQVRAGLSWSPLDAYKALGVLAVADADCAQHEAATSAAELVAAGADIGRAAALAKESAFLVARAPSWEAIVAKGEERLAAGAGTLTELRDLRGRAAALERKRAQVDGEIARLAARGGATPSRPIAAIEAEIESASARYERAASHVRGLAAWQVTLTGGVVPQDRPADWYGVVQISYSFGGPFQVAHEGRALEARASEIAHARYEIGGQLRRLREELHASRVLAQKELAVLDGEARSIEDAAAKLAASTAPDAVHAQEIAALDAIAIGSERVYVAALVAELARAEEIVK